jgi:hypothetical protein
MHKELLVWCIRCYLNVAPSLPVSFPGPFVEALHQIYQYSELPQPAQIWFQVALELLLNYMYIDLTSAHAATESKESSHTIVSAHMPTW